MIPISSNFIQFLVRSFHHPFWIMTSVSPFNTPAGPSDPAQIVPLKKRRCHLLKQTSSRTLTATTKVSAGCVVGGAASKELPVTRFVLHMLSLTSIKLQSFLRFFHSTFDSTKLLAAGADGFGGFCVFSGAVFLAFTSTSAWQSCYLCCGQGDSGLCRSWNFGSLLWLRLREGYHTGDPAYIWKWHPWQLRMWQELWRH